MAREHNIVELVGENYDRGYAKTVTTVQATIGSNMGAHGVIAMSEEQIIEAAGGEISITEARQVILTAYNSILYYDQIEIPRA